MREETYFVNLAALGRKVVEHRDALWALLHADGSKITDRNSKAVESIIVDADRIRSEEGE